MNFKITSTEFSDVFLISSKNFVDNRGFFSEIFSENFFSGNFNNIHFVQDNFSVSKKGTLRGLHFQTRKPQAKFLRVISGKIYDVIVDIRPHSPTFGKWQGYILSAENADGIFIPRGFAHGFLALEDGTQIFYKCDDFYDPGFEGGLLWNDKDLQIDWQKYFQEFQIDEKKLEISEKDQKNMTFAELKNLPIFTHL